LKYDLIPYFKDTYLRYATPDASIGEFFRVKNEFAGHKVPTGDPERFFNISFVLKNNSGIILSSKTDRIGEEWEWYPEAKKLADYNLLPNEERTFDFKYLAEKAEELTLFVTVSKHRLDQESADYNNLKDNYPLSIIVFEEQYCIEIK